MFEKVDRDGKGVLKKRKKVLEKRNKGLPLPNFHQKKRVGSEQKLRIRTEEFIEDI